MKTHFVMMANYNKWANARLFRAAGMLSEAMYRKEVGVYFRESPRHAQPYPGRGSHLDAPPDRNRGTSRKTQRDIV